MKLYELKNGDRFKVVGYDKVFIFGGCDGSCAKVFETEKDYELFVRHQLFWCNLAVERANR